MSNTKRRALSLTLVAAMFFALAIPASARASEYIKSVAITTTPSGNGKILIKVDVLSTDIMQEVGLVKIIVNEKSASGSYRPVYTFTKDQYNMLAKQRSSYTITVTYQGTPGKDYYITAQCYAKNTSGSGTSWAGSKTVHV